MANQDFNKPHFFLNSTATTQNFTTPSRRIPPVITPEQNRQEHSRKLRGDLAVVSTQLNTLKASATGIELEMGLGIQVEFESFSGIELVFESLADARYGIDLHNIKSNTDGDETKTTATVFIPDGKLNEFEKKITGYLAQGNNKKLIDTIETIRTAAFSAIWSDEDVLLPESEEESIWWEIWISTPKRNRETTSQFSKIISDFNLIANELGISVSQHNLRFPEHTVINVNATQNQLSSSTLLLSRVAEIRLPRITADFFDSANSEEQVEWSEDLLSRLQQPNNADTPYICILDSGVNVLHPLLAPFAKVEDQLTVTDDRVSTDEQGHGTEMAGLAIWGDLTDALGTNETATINHRFESVKVIARDGDNKEKPLGKVTSDAIATAEIANPARSRVFSMSLSANSGTDGGRPSSWSSTLDALSVDYLGESESPRLFTICAGNVVIPSDMEYPNENKLQDIHDPAQAWNPITVGAYTNKVTIAESSDYQPLANAGGLSPYSTTSLVWDRRNAPIKPEVVFEGGNVGRDEYGCAGMQDLHLLSTYHDFSQRHFQSSNATSAATALAARFSAQIKAEYPHLWPETVRALIVHCAEWTADMYSLVSINSGARNIRKCDMSNLTRMVGFGVPNLEKALKTANNSLSLVIQDELQPFHKLNGSVKTKDMHLHDLPWPRDALQLIGEADVELTITLSYFIEPNPSSRNILNKYNYASHQLRFDVKRPEESKVEFERRVNAAAGERVEDSPTDSNWTLGGANRHKGSIHKDIWKGSAAELADRGKIAIYPANGWWRTRTSHERWDSKARYALIVTLSVPEVDVDIYTEVETKIEAMVSAQVVVGIDA